MRIEATNPATVPRPETKRQDQPRQDSVNHESQPSAGPGQALIPVNSPPVVTLASHRHQASFLAHLIATREQAPQTRDRRRADPAEAAAAYRVMAKLSDQWNCRSVEIESRLRRLAISGSLSA